MSAHVDIAYPFTGLWRVQNSPADRVPSHGTAAFASAHAIDFVPVSPEGQNAPIRLRSLLRPEPPDRFIGFGRPIHAPLDGIVVAADDTATDHHAHRGFPSISYALTQRGRASRGWRALVGTTYSSRVAASSSCSATCSNRVCGCDRASGSAPASTSRAVGTRETAPNLTSTSRRWTVPTSTEPRRSRCRTTARSPTTAKSSTCRSNGELAPEGERLPELGCTSDCHRTDLLPDAGLVE